jgi:hypothetical protein
MHKYVTLVADIMFVNGLPFLVTSSRGISLVMIEFLSSQTAKCSAITYKRVKRVYGTVGFIVQVDLMDTEFDKLKVILPNIMINTMVAREHVGEIERKI